MTAREQLEQEGRELYWLDDEFQDRDVADMLDQDWCALDPDEQLHLAMKYVRAAYGRGYLQALDRGALSRPASRPQ